MELRPRQFLNAGVAEQNMTGIAAGMAMSGKIAFTYSIANFPTLRCLEQVRNDVCYDDANVKIVSVGGGVAYGALSVTHHAVEDLGVMRCLPNLLSRPRRSRGDTCRDARNHSAPRPVLPAPRQSWRADGASGSD